ncbi:BTB domain containing protein [Pandoravirus dulcis]|uniref:BTB domain containing protein n=1 Tax=Pandoravirus dulcis TaxID=1349409 RepID=S4VWY7_9VIRU|nr:BTB domain containing protein [Pandoravirus dulcis]AGO82424.1 BTB domain containing protein [Pandoravirus dulcis]
MSDAGLLPHEPRHVHCDCVINLRRSDTMPDTAVRIEAHRVFLAAASYFAALFEHADPDGIEQKDLDGKRVFRVVYTVDMPFTADSVAFLIDCLYGGHRIDRVADCVDPVDAIHASLFMGMPVHYTAGLIEAALGRLLLGLSPADDDDNDDEGNTHAAAQLGAFVRHLVHSDIARRAKMSLLERTLALLPKVDRNALEADCTDLIPSVYYRPEAVVGNHLAVDDKGRRWRALRIPADFSMAANASRIAWQGLDFGVQLYYSTRGHDGPEVRASVSCAPTGETLGVWAWGQTRPDGAVDVEPRCIKIVMRAYHATQGSHTCDVFEGVSFADNRSDTEQAERYAARGRAVPEGAVLAPFALDWTTKRSRQNARRTIQVAHVFECECDTRAMRSLMACEVEIQVEEIS